MRARSASSRSSRRIGRTGRGRARRPATGASSRSTSNRRSRPASGATRRGTTRRARAGDIKDFTGVDAPYEIPERPGIVIDTETQDIETCVAQLLEFVVGAGCRLTDWPVRDDCATCGALGALPNAIELVVRTQGDQVRHPVRQAEERRDVADVPDVLVAEAVRAQRRESSSSISPLRSETLSANASIAFCRGVMSAFR